MFTLYAEKNKLTLRGRETLTSGSVNVYDVRFTFSADWDGLSRIAVFRAGTSGEPTAVKVDENGGCVIPWEALTKKGVLLMAGVYGTGEGGEIVLPTVWASLGTIFEGAKLGQNTQPPTPDLWQQELAGKADGLDYTTDGELGLYAGKKLLSSVPIQGGGGGGVSDHRLLSHREDENQHPISSIIRLEETLETIPTAMTAEELRKILMT